MKRNSALVALVAAVIAVGGLTAYAVRPSSPPPLVPWNLR